MECSKFSVKNIRVDYKYALEIGIVSHPIQKYLLLNM